MAWNKKEACIWHAFKSLDLLGQGQVETSRLKVLTHNVASSLGLLKVEERMDEFTKRKQVAFDQYITFFRGEVESHTGAEKNRMSTVMAMEKIDEVCWFVCSMHYTRRDSPKLNKDSVHKLWRIFNMLCEVDDSGTVIFPVVVDYEEVAFFLEKMYKINGCGFDVEVFEKEYATELPTFSFEQFVNLVETHHCGEGNGKLDVGTVESAILDLCDELVAKVLKKGYLHKKGNTMKKTIGGWKERWFTLGLQELVYYTSRDEKEKKGEIPTSTFVNVVPVEDKGSAGKHARFNLVCSGRTYEIYAQDQRTRIEWMTVLKLARELNASPDDYPPIKARDKRREMREGRRKRAREDADKMRRQGEELEAVRKALQQEAEKRKEELEAERKQREEAMRLQKEEEERFREELEASRRKLEEEKQARLLMEEKIREEEEQRRQDMERSKQKLDEQKRAWEEAESRMQQHAGELQASIEEAERVRQQQAEKSQEMLESEQQARAELEAQLEEEKNVLGAERRRLQELEALQKELEMLLDQERQAKRDEELVRAAQARVLQEELEQKEELLRVKLEMEEAIAEEQRRRVELETLKQTQDEELKLGQRKMEELTVIKQKQDVMLRAEQEKLLKLEEAKSKHEELLREGKEKLEMLTKEKAEMQGEYSDALVKLQEAEQAKASIQQNLMKKEQEKPFVVVGLARPIQPQARPLLTHRGEGATTLEELKVKARKWSQDRSATSPTSVSSKFSFATDSGGPSPVAAKRSNRKMNKGSQAIGVTTGAKCSPEVAETAPAGDKSPGSEKDDNSPRDTECTRSNTSTDLCGQKHGVHGVHGVRPRTPTLSVVDESSGSAADGSSTGAQHPDGSSTGAQHPDGSSTGAQHPDGSSTGAQHPDGSSTGAQNPDGSSTRAQHPDGSSTGAQHPDGSSTGAQHPDGSSTGAQDDTPANISTTSDVNGNRPATISQCTPSCEHEDGLDSSDLQLSTQEENLDVLETVATDERAANAADDFDGQQDTNPDSEQRHIERAPVISHCESGNGGHLVETTN